MNDAELGDGSRLDYDHLVVCAGARFKPALEGAATFACRGEPFRADGVLL